ncbi:hypothetical protein [Qipengyuania sp.]|uniref:hypothetical protein n=1 Tax=Qipengyuania sp. TaxID=2004515 RepID=UPI0035C7BDAF
MISSPLTWGAGAACLIGGAIAGAALGSTPVIDRASMGAFYAQEQDTSPPMVTDSAGEQLPDHYPLVTARGTVPVEQLSDRGLYSQARYQSHFSYGEYDPYDETVPADYHIDDYAPPRQEPRYVARDLSQEAGAKSARQTQRAVPSPAGVVVPLRLAEGPASIGQAVQPLNIKVSAQLAN